MAGWRATRPAEWRNTVATPPPPARVVIDKRQASRDERSGLRSHRIDTLRMRKPQAGKRRANPHGFTLIELMIAVAIVAIIVAVALPSYRSSIQKGKRAEAMAAFSSVQQAQERWRSNNPTYTTVLANLGLASTDLYEISLAAPTSGTLNTGYVVVADARGSQAGDSACKRMSVRMINGNLSYGSCESCTTFTYAGTNTCFNR